VLHIFAHPYVSWNPGWTRQSLWEYVGHSSLLTPVFLANNWTTDCCITHAYRKPGARGRCIRTERPGAARGRAGVLNNIYIYIFIYNFEMINIWCLIALWIRPAKDKIHHGSSTSRLPPLLPASSSITTAAGGCRAGRPQPPPLNYPAHPNLVVFHTSVAGPPSIRPRPAGSASPRLHRRPNRGHRRSSGAPQPSLLL
jgi:hypothetical protein